MPRIIDVSLIQDMDEVLLPHLYAGMNFSGGNFARMAEKWLAEDSSVSQRRSDLQASQLRIDAATRALR